jgi:hypothetical protein
MSILILIFNLLPVILAAVQSIETAIPISQAGKAKLDLILGVVSDVYSADKNIHKAMPLDAMTAVVTSIVGRVVKVLNIFGVFHTVAPQPLLPVPAAKA